MTLFEDLTHAQRQRAVTAAFPKVLEQIDPEYSSGRSGRQLSTDLLRLMHLCRDQCPYLWAAVLDLAQEAEYRDVEDGPPVLAIDLNVAHEDDWDVESASLTDEDPRAVAVDTESEPLTPWQSADVPPTSDPDEPEPELPQPPIRTERFGDYAAAVVCRPGVWCRLKDARLSTTVSGISAPAIRLLDIQSLIAVDFSQQRGIWSHPEGGVEIRPCCAQHRPSSESVRIDADQSFCRRYGTKIAPKHLPADWPAVQADPDTVFVGNNQEPQP